MTEKFEPHKGEEIPDLNKLTLDLVKYISFNRLSSVHVERVVFSMNDKEALSELDEISLALAKKIRECTEQGISPSRLMTLIKAMSSVEFESPLEEYKDFIIALPITDIEKKMLLQLVENPADGGVLSIREKKTKEIIYEISIPTFARDIARVVKDTIKLLIMTHGHKEFSFSFERK